MITKRIEVTEEINASAERVWDVLLDFEAWPQWNTFIERVEGRVAPAATVQLHVRLGSKRVRKWERIELIRHGEVLTWSTYFLHPWLHFAHRRQTVEPLESGRSRYRSVEVMTGPLTLLILALLGNDIRRGFATMAAELRRRAENR